MVGMNESISEVQACAASYPKRHFGCFALLVLDPNLGDAYVKDENALLAAQTERFCGQPCPSIAFSHCFHSRRAS